MTPLKSDELGVDTTVIGRWQNGFTWMAHPGTTMRRASHAIAIDDEVWLIDPLDAEGLDRKLDEVGPVAGVVVLTNTHNRHADRLAARHEVAIHVPACFEREAQPANGWESPVAIIDGELADTGFQLVWEKVGRGWREGALYHPERGTLVVADVLMTALLTARHGRLEVLPFFKFSPPRNALGDLSVERILVGHGEPVLENAQEALGSTLDGTGSPAPIGIIRNLPTLARQIYAELGS